MRRNDPSPPHHHFALDRCGRARGGCGIGGGLVTRIERGPGWELRCGRWQDVLGDVTSVVAVITDPPFSERTAKGFKSNPEWSSEIGAQPGIEYGAISSSEIVAAVDSWTPRTERWFVAFGDHITAFAWEAALQASGWLTFAPLPWIKPDAPPRFLADGPASQSEYVTTAERDRVQVARPRSLAYAEDRRSRPGYYLAARGKGPVQGTKDLATMRRLVRDYSLPGDLIVDPFAGWATTILACALEGRRAIGAEMDPETFDKAVRRLREHESRFMTQEPGIAKAPRMRQQALVLYPEASE